MKITRKKKLTLIVMLVLLVVCVASVYLNNWIRNRPPEPKQIKLMNEPELVVWWFHQALIEDNITLAKEYVTADNQGRIDKWQRDTQRSNYGCEFDWSWFFKHPLEFQQISWGSASSVKIDDFSIEVDSAIGCYSNNYSMKLHKVVVERIRNEWVITNWNKICEDPPSNRPDNSTEICYQ
jgi:hypothetical protein